MKFSHLETLATQFSYLRSPVCFSKCGSIYAHQVTVSSSAHIFLFTTRVLNTISNMKTTVKRRRALRVRNKRNNDNNNNSGSSSNGADNDGCFRNWNDLILVHLFSWLPVKSLMRFKSVAKHWKSIITHDKCLMKLHESRRHKGVTSFLVCPTWSYISHDTPPCPFPVTVEIRSIMFSPKDLRSGKRGSSSYSGGTNVVALFRSHNNVILNARYNVLPPVNGLMCFVNCDDPDSFLIYNPCTREKTAWIQVSTYDLFVTDFGQQQVADSPENLRLEYDYTFGFGYDQITRKHKVVCVYVITVFKRGYQGGFRSFDIFDRHKVMCGVFTIGENKWIEIDSHQVPSRIANNKKYVYVNGSLCWIHYRSHPRKSEVIVFDMGRETFRVITIPDCIPKDLYSSRNTGKLVNELAEIDGNLAVLVQEKSDQLNLWIYNDTTGNVHDKWMKETIQIPYQWDELVNLDFKGVTGTELAVVKFIETSRKQHECVIYYNRKEKKYYQNRHVSLLELTSHTYPADARYQITPFVETLLPVQTTQDGEEIN